MTAAAAAIGRGFTIQGGLGRAFLATTAVIEAPLEHHAVSTRRRNPFRHRWSRPRVDGEGDVAVALSLSGWLMRARRARLGRLQPGRFVGGMRT